MACQYTEHFFDVFNMSFVEFNIVCWTLQDNLVLPATCVENAAQELIFFPGIAEEWMVDDAAREND